jgi:hypothetical protein
MDALRGSQIKEPDGRIAVVWVAEFVEIIGYLGQRLGGGRASGNKSTCKGDCKR